MHGNSRGEPIGKRGHKNNSKNSDKVGICERMERLLLFVRA